jgi:UDP:flavonoid glycosyltransferase YjiC (YdhE family)
MKIVLATYGSRGDVQPMLALSLSLKSEGHDVLLVAPPEKADWAEQLGCPFHPLGADLTAFLDSVNDAHSYRSGVSFLVFIRNEINRQFEILPKIIAGADLVIGSSLAFALPTVAEYMGIEYRYIAFTPQLLPSGYHPFPAIKYHGYPRWVNRMTWRVVKIFDRFNLTLLVNKKRRQLGLPSIQDSWLHILGRHVFVASDTAISEVPPDIAPTFTQTGYMHLNQPDQYYPELDEFIDAGPAPVYAGFGSMPKLDQIRNVAKIVAAARLAGQRAVIGKFWDEPSELSDSDDIFFITKYPHLKLFPKMAAVIHHGGAGTTASSAISGVPQIIVPHALDQFYWGHKIYRSNLGPKPISRPKLTSEKLAAAIRECLANERIRQNAENLARTIRRQDSVKIAVHEIMKSLNKSSSLHSTVMSSMKPTVF